MRLVAVALAVAFGSGVRPAPAADFADPTWPCIQRKVEDLSPGLMWPLPIEPIALEPAVEAEVDDLVGQLALRRLPVAEVAPALDTFVARHGTDPALLGQVFQGAFDRLAADRRAIVRGIADYSLGQIDRAAAIEAARAEMAAEMDRDDPDFDRVDALEEQLAWDERIYADRQQSLTYVCETPVLIERRIYEIAQLLQGALGG